MKKTLTKAWGNYEPGRVLTDDREELPESPKGTVLVHPTRMEALQAGGYFGPAKEEAPEKKSQAPVASTPPPVPVYIRPAPAAMVAKLTDDSDHEPAERKPDGV